MAYLLSNIVPKITRMRQLLLKLSLVVGWYPFFVAHMHCTSLLSFVVTRCKVGRRPLLECRAKPVEICRGAPNYRTDLSRQWVEVNHIVGT